MARDLPSDIIYPQVPPRLSQYNIPLSTFISAHSTYHGLVVAGLILRVSSQTNKPEILLLKRALTDSFPNTWEPPGGSVDADDESIMHAVVREVWEETGLRIAGFGTGRIVRDDVGEKYHGAKSEGDEGWEFTEVTFRGRRGEKGCKLNFVVEIKANVGEELHVELDESEHQEWRWFDEDAVENLSAISSQGREVVLNALKS